MLVQCKCSRQCAQCGLAAFSSAPTLAFRACSEQARNACLLAISRLRVYNTAFYRPCICCVAVHFGSLPIACQHATPTYQKDNQREAACGAGAPSVAEAEAEVCAMEHAAAAAALHAAQLAASAGLDYAAPAGVAVDLSSIENARACCVLHLLSRSRGDGKAAAAAALYAAQLVMSYQTMPRRRAVQ